MLRNIENIILSAMIFCCSVVVISCKDRLSDPQDVPRNVLMVINHDAVATSDTVVCVTISGENISVMQISTSPDLRDVDWVRYDTVKVISAPKYSGTFDVFGKFKSVSGASTGILHDSIILDYTALINSLEIFTERDSLTSNDSISFILETGECGEAFVSLGSMISGYNLDPVSEGIFRGSFLLPMFGVPNETIHVVGYFSDEVGNWAEPLVHPRELVLYGSEFQPSIVRRVYLDSQSNDDLVIHSGYCFISTSDWLHMLDVRSPEAPELFLSFDLPGWNHGISATDTTIGVANNIQGTVFYSLNNINEPARAGVARVESIARDVIIDDHYAYVASFSKGLHVFDLVVGNSPKRLKRLLTTPFGEHLVQADTILFFAGGGGLTVFNVADPAEPEMLIEMTDFHDEPKGMLYYRNNLFICTDEDGLMRVDVQNPRRPVIKTFYRHLKGGRRMALAYPYLAISRGTEVTVVNISDLRALPEVAHFDDLAGANGIGFNGQTLYISTENELLVVDMTED